ncbi:hypothetical protein PR048_006447 [Dryococelus australis]|uniref:Uncharacterized protein n=1 Tax=Dryococelus australis TaxID=614101 RepID=A0ABQ9IB19_9NEOP|nr:hypothetical protein PR048_006447 [Dryococelus australis]
MRIETQLKEEETAEPRENPHTTTSPATLPTRELPPREFPADRSLGSKRARGKASQWLVHTHSHARLTVHDQRFVLAAHLALESTVRRVIRYQVGHVRRRQEGVVDGDYLRTIDRPVSPFARPPYHQENATGNCESTNMGGKLTNTHVYKLVREAFAQEDAPNATEAVDTAGDDVDNLGLLLGGGFPGLPRICQGRGRRRGSGRSCTQSVANMKYQLPDTHIRKAHMAIHRASAWANRKLADQRHRHTRSPRAEIRERPGRGLNPDRLDTLLYCLWRVDWLAEIKPEEGKGVDRNFSGLKAVQWLDYSPPTKVKRVRFPARSLPGFRAWESCRSILLVGGFPRGSSVSMLLQPGIASMLTSPSSALKTSTLRVAQISPLNCFKGGYENRQSRVQVNCNEKTKALFVSTLACWPHPRYSLTLLHQLQIPRSQRLRAVNHKTTALLFSRQHPATLATINITFPATSPSLQTTSRLGRQAGRQAGTLAGREVASQLSRSSVRFHYHVVVMDNVVD